MLAGIEDQENWHGKALGAKGDACIEHLQRLVENSSRMVPNKVVQDDAPAVNISNLRLSEPPAYKMGEKIATRLAYGTALVKLGKNNRCVVALDAEVKNSTFAIKFKVGALRRVTCAGDVTVLLFAGSVPRPLRRVLHR